MKRDQYFLRQISTQATEVKFDRKTDWMQSILNELHEDLSPEEVKVIEAKEDINFEGTLERRVGTRYGDYALLRGNVSAHYYTYCVQSGEIIKDQVHAEVKATFLDEDYCKRYQLEEETTLFLEDEEYELYYLEDNKLNLFQVVNEAVFLNKNPYPKKTPTT